jgi:hypothetical protein
VNELRSEDGRGSSAHFRLEFVFKIKDFTSGLAMPFEDFQGIDIGRLTFYHPTTAQLPVSAVCLLSRQVWKEFGIAINRIMASPIVGSDDQKPGKGTTASQLSRHMPATTPLPLEWAAPVDYGRPSADNQR